MVEGNMSKEETFLNLIRKSGYEFDFNIIKLNLNHILKSSKITK